MTNTLFDIKTQLHQVMNKNYEKEVEISTLYKDVGGYG